MYVETHTLSKLREEIQSNGCNPVEFLARDALWDVSAKPSKEVLGE